MNGKAETITAPIRVVVAGSSGKIGQLMVRDLGKSEDIEVVGGFRSTDTRAAVDALLARADVLVDFTSPIASPDILRRAVAARVRPVSGTSGLTEETLSAIDAACRAQGIAAMWAPNYNLPAALMQHLARIAAKHMDSVEILEAHSQNKKDSPSGTAVALARAMREARGSDFPDPDVEHHVISGTRGGVEGGVRIHAMRLPLSTGWHEAVFASANGTLTIRLDGRGNESRVAVIAKAVREVMRPGRVGLIRGAETLFGLDEG